MWIAMIRWRAFKLRIRVKAKTRFLARFVVCQNFDGCTIEWLRLRSVHQDQI